jgi:hypothetical protein
LYLISSFANSPCQSISNGGVFDLASNSTFEIIISISQVCIFGLFCQSGLALTFQVALITNSLLKESAISQASFEYSGSKTI